MTVDTGFVSIDWAGRPVQLEYQWHRPSRTDRPLLIFLHEGLGSVSMWRDFPAALCEAADVRGLVYSRPGYGRSSARPAGERWRPDFMHRQADEVLPALLRALDIRERPFLFGHSDGGSIALLYAAHFPQALAGAIVVAPHILVEAFGLASIRKAREAYAANGLRERLARHHQDVDSAFYGWNDIWLDPAFEAWNIEDELPAIRCPLLAVQGLDDEYGTLEQIRGIARRVPQARLLEIPHCGHSPHRDQPQALLAATAGFLREHESGTMAPPSSAR
jgi:pimeloyl-ACP methyl ester carboxylesterase